MTKAPAPQTSPRQSLGEQGPAWSTPRRVTLADGIVDQILHEFFAGNLRPGDFIGTEASLSEQFGVSRMALRDAVRALDAYGVVETRKGAGGGIRVARGDPDRFINALAVQMRLLGVAPAQAFDAQFAIESQTAGMAAEHATPTEIAHLAAILGEAEACIIDRPRWLEHIFAFHIALAEAAHSPALSLLLRAFIKILAPHYARRTTRERAEGATANYKRLLNAVERRDGEDARAIMQRQLGQVRLGLPHRHS